MNFDRASDHVLRQLIEFHLRVLRDLRGVEESTHLFLHRAERQHDFAEHFIEHLRESGVDRREAANDSFIASRMFKAGAGAGEITAGKQKEKNGQLPENDLPGNVQPQGANEHHCGE